MNCATPVYNTLIDYKILGEITMTNTFSSLKISEQLITGLSKQNISEPMPIQSLVIPVALENKDLVATSHTGSGKTLAYLLPLFEKIDPSLKQVQAIILAPTHELVVQINEQIKRLATLSEVPIASTTLMGGMNIEKQIKTLKTKPQIVVGSSGRILDLIKKKKLTAHTIRTLIIDEADNLLDKNQSVDVKSIVKAVLRDTQIMLFSATINERTLADSQTFMKEPVVINCSETLLNPNITHHFAIVEQRKKFETLRKLINTYNPTKALVFVNNIHEVEVMVEKLVYHKKLAGGLYGSQTKQQRQQTLESFRSGKLNILVSSDLSARGLDIPDISYIFNLDLPPSSHDYLHRAGRTARGNNTGTAICLITEREQSVLKEYAKKLSIEVTPLK